MTTNALPTAPINMLSTRPMRLVSISMPAPEPTPDCSAAGILARLGADIGNGSTRHNRRRDIGTRTVLQTLAQI